MRIVAVVPMKLHNERLPGKNTKLLGDRPLCSYILNTLAKVQGLNGVYVYCSSPTVKQYLPPAVRYLKRCEDLDSNATSMNEVLLSFAQEIASDYYLLAHATAPFLSADSVQRGIEAVKSGQYDSAFSAIRMQDFLWQDGVPINYSLDRIPRTQDLPVLYKETSGFYLYSSEFIVRHHRRVGNHPYIVEVSEMEAIDIDTLDDFELAAFISIGMENNSSKGNM